MRVGLLLLALAGLGSSCSEAGGAALIEPLPTIELCGLEPADEDGRRRAHFVLRNESSETFTSPSRGEPFVGYYDLGETSHMPFGLCGNGIRWEELPGHTDLPFSLKLREHRAVRLEVRLLDQREERALAASRRIVVGNPAALPEENRGWALDLSRFGDLPERTATASYRSPYRSEPILRVTRPSDPDGRWEFSTPAEEDTGRYTIEHLVRLDPTLLEVLDLEPGGRAERAGPGATWVRRSPAVGKDSNSR